MDNLIAIGIRKRIEESISSELGIPKSDAEKIFNFIKLPTRKIQKNLDVLNSTHPTPKILYLGTDNIISICQRIVSDYSTLFRYYTHQRSRLSYMQYVRNIISGVL